MITVRFSCRVCGLKDVLCEVRARERDEDINKYLGNVMAAAVRLKHTTLSLFCESNEISNLKVPIDPNDPEAWIGKQTDIVPPEGITA